MNAGEIADEFDISKPSISHHLNVLKSADLVIVQRNGQQMVYSLNSSVVQEFLQQVMSLFNVGDGQEDDGPSVEHTDS